MKIYCSSNNTFDRFVGKDLWVKVNNRITDYTYYIQILHKDPGNVLWCHRIGFTVIDDDSFDLSHEYNWYEFIHGKVYREYGNYLDIVQPINVLTTEEISDVIQSKLNRRQ